MSFNCLTCNRKKRVVGTERDQHKERCGDHNHHMAHSLKAFVLCKGDRSWSGNLGPMAPYEKFECDDDQLSSPRIFSSNNNNNIKGRKRSKSIAISNGHVMRLYEDEIDEEPRLVRSGGMRRDWSFEDLKKRAREIKEQQTQEKKQRQECY